MLVNIGLYNNQIGHQEETTFPVKQHFISIFIIGYILYTNLDKDANICNIQKLKTGSFELENKWCREEDLNLHGNAPTST